MFVSRLIGNSDNKKTHDVMASKKPVQLLVIGYGRDHCTREAYEVAYKIGEEIAKHGAILISGDLRGVMEAVVKALGNMAACYWNCPSRQ